MSQKKFIQIIIIFVVALWVFCLSTFTAVRIKNAQEAKKPSETYPIIETGTTPDYFFETTTAPQIKETAPLLSMDGNNVTTQPNVGKPDWQIAEEESIEASKEASRKAEEAKTTKKSNVPVGKKEIVAAYVSAANKAKNTGSFKVVKSINLGILLDDIQMGSGTSLDLAKSMVDKYIQGNAGEEVNTYNFSNGIDTASGKTPNQVIPPVDAPVTLDHKLVTSAKATEGANGSYKIRLTLGKQTQTISTPAPGYSASMNIIDINSIGLSSSITVTEMTIVYDSGVIEATIDKNGRLVEMTHSYQVPEGTGSGKLTLIPGTLKMHGDFISTYNFSY